MPPGKKELAILEKLDGECNQLVSIAESLFENKKFLTELTSPDATGISRAMREYGLMQLSLIVALTEVLHIYKTAHDLMHQGMLMIQDIEGLAKAVEASRASKSN